jgi:hypothetical protein
VGKKWGECRENGGECRENGEKN